MPTFAYTILYVTDVLKSIEFYEKAFSFDRKFITPEKDYAELLSGETTIAFATIELAKSNLSAGFQAVNLNEKPFGIELGITTDNPKEIMNKVVQFGGFVYEELKMKPWGQEVGYVRDVNGFLIEICTPMSSE